MARVNVSARMMAWTRRISLSNRFAGSMPSAAVRGNGRSRRAREETLSGKGRSQRHDRTAAPFRPIADGTVAPGRARHHHRALPGSARAGRPPRGARHRDSAAHPAYGVGRALPRRSPREGEARMARILYVEDNDDNVYMLKNRLERRGHAVLVARDGRAGVEAARAELPDLILLDLGLPVIDGWEAALAPARPGFAGDRRRGGAPPPQGGGAPPPHPGDRAPAPRHGGRPRPGARGRLRRLRHQPGRFRPPARPHRGPARAPAVSGA